MSNDAEIKNTNYYIDLLEKLIAEERIIYYKYSDFKNIQQIEGNVFRATWKSADTLLALKSFNSKKATQKVVNEVQYLFIFHYERVLIKLINQRKKNFLLIR
jgi:hypothetical protein